MPPAHHTADPTLHIDGLSLTLEDVERVARRQVSSFALTDGARRAMEKSRARVCEVIDSGATVYGVNTGFGHFANVRVADDKLEQLQLNLVRSHAVGTGEPLPLDAVRGLMLLRANVLARGHSGARPAVAEQLLCLLTHDVCPVVPRQGSVGASGDLAPLAHVALVLVGEGEACLAGEQLAGAEALRRAGIEPLALAAKEGLALLNGTQMMTGIGALACRELEDLCALADLAGALTVEALGGRRDAFEPQIAALRPHPGQVAVAEHLTALLHDSELADRHDAVRVQDAYSLRCMPQVHGSARDVCRAARATLAIEINAVTDNPIILDDGRVISGGNFHGQPVAFALDALAIAAADLASISERRVNRLVNPTLSGLPAFLVQDGGLQSGMLVTQTVAAALVSESRGLAVPASADSIPTSADQEDHVSMGAWGAWKAWQVVANCRRVLAIELLCACEAMEFHAPARPAPRLRPLRDFVRSHVAPLQGDRSLSPDIMRLEDVVRSGALLQAVRR
jgi:histidine ammonia-lyase